MVSSNKAENCQEEVPSGGRLERSVQRPERGVRTAENGFREGQKTKRTSSREVRRKKTEEKPTLVTENRCIQRKTVIFV